MADSQRVIGTCALLVVGIGSLNTIHKKKQLPSSRFLIGTGVAFFILSAIAEAEPDVAKALSLAVLTTVLFGQGDGALTYLNGKNETDTRRVSKTGTPKGPPTSTDYAHGVVNDPATIPNPTHLQTLTPFPNIG